MLEGHPPVARLPHSARDIRPRRIRSSMGRDAGHETPFAATDVGAGRMPRETFEYHP
jgi:hypothetical protein